jgi:hypothetical protein
MPNFKEIASRMRAEYEARVEEADRKVEAERDAKDAFKKAAVAHLQKEVMPLLGQAKIDFAESGIACEIDQEPDTRGGSSYHFVFRLLSPARSIDGHRVKMPPVFLDSDGAKINVGIGEDALDRTPKRTLGSSPPQDVETLVTAAMEETLKFYFEKVEYLRRSGRD